MASLPRLSNCFECKHSCSTPFSLGDCLVARPADICLPRDSFSQKSPVVPRRKTSLTSPQLFSEASQNQQRTNGTSSSESSRGDTRRSFSLGNCTRPSSPMDNRAVNSMVQESVGGSEVAQLSPLRKCGKNVAPVEMSQESMALPDINPPRRRRSASLTNSGSQGEVPSLSRQERIEKFEVQRRQDARKHDRRLQKLLKVQAVELKSNSADKAIDTAKRMAEYESTRKERVERDQERAQQAKAFVMHRMQEAQAPTDFAHRMVTKMLYRAGWDGCHPKSIPREVTNDMFDEDYEKAKHDFYQPKVQQCLWPICRTDQMRGELEKVIMESSQPWTWLGALRTKSVVDVLTQSNSVHELAKNISDSTQLSCQICMDPMLAAEDDGHRVQLQCNIWSAAPRKNEHWNNNACGHTFCRTCVQTWANSAIKEQRLNIKCPAAGCKYHLWDQDLQELLSPQMFARHQEHKHADHLKNLQDIAKHDDVLMKWLQQHARPCPRCHVIVSRSEGCNKMTCVCGNSFCYACGFERCLCSVHDKADIWNPKK